jgi:hypothetical protein
MKAAIAVAACLGLEFLRLKKSSNDQVLNDVKLDSQGSSKREKPKFTAQTNKQFTCEWHMVDTHSTTDKEDLVNAAGTTLRVFCDLKDVNAEQRKGLCIVEGAQPIQRLLRSDLQIVALAATPSMLSQFETDLVSRQNRGHTRNQQSGEDEAIQVYVLSQEQLVRVVNLNCRTFGGCQVPH